MIEKHRLDLPDFLFLLTRVSNYLALELRIEYTVSYADRYTEQIKKKHEKRCSPSVDVTLGPSLYEPGSTPVRIWRNGRR